MTTDEMKDAHAAQHEAILAAHKLGVRFGNVWGHADLMHAIIRLQERVDQLEAKMQLVEWGISHDD